MDSELLAATTLRGLVEQQKLEAAQQHSATPHLVPFGPHSPLHGAGWLWFLMMEMEMMLLKIAAVRIIKAIYLIDVYIIVVERN